MSAKAAGHWSKGLLSAMNDPEAVVDTESDLVTIKDKYPKVKKMFLLY